MSQPVPNPPYNYPIVDQTGRLTAIGAAFFRTFYERIGGASALSNIELENISSGTELQAEITALAAVVTENKADADLSFSDFGQGRAL